MQRQAPPVDFGGFDFSGFQAGQGPARGGAAGRWIGFMGQLPGYFLGDLYRNEQQKRAGRGPEPGTDLEYQAPVDFWTAIRGGNARIEIHRQEVCPTCHGQASSGAAITCPECSGTGQVTQMGGRMKFNIPCPRCGGSGRIQCLPDLPWRGAGSSDGVDRVSHQGGDAGRAADSAAGQGQRRGEWRRAGRPVCHCPDGLASGVYAGGGRYPSQRPDYRCRGCARGQGGCADDRWAAQLRIPPGTQSGQKLRMRERGVESAAPAGQRGDEIVTVEVVVPQLNDERSREIMREFAKLNNQDPRVTLFDKI
jgi:molecular chaperone DnaJ